MTKSELQQAFRTAASGEFSSIPSDESRISYTFSQRFNKRMEKLIRNQKKAYWPFLNTRVKRAAIVFAVLILLFATACSVKEIREPVVNFVKEVYETFSSYFFEGDTVDQITKEYAITKLPEGFVQTDKIVSASVIMTVYENEKGGIIHYWQLTTRYGGASFDRENLEETSLQVNDCQVDVYFNEKILTAIWGKDVYSFQLMVEGQIELEEIKKMIESIE